MSFRYFDIFLDAFERGDEESAEAFGSTVHWGYWDAPDRADGTVADFARAAERMNVEMTELAGLAPGKRVLDVGCGFGGTIASINRRLRGMSLVGVNVEQRQLDRAARLVEAANGNRITWVCADACDLPFEDQSFDVIMVVEAICHFQSRARFFAKARRMLAQGGVLVVSDFVPSALLTPGMRWWYRTMGLAFERHYGHVDVTYGIRDYRALARRTGFVSRRERDVTVNTLPSYALTRRLMWRYPLPLREALSNDGINRAMAWASSRGLLRYMLLAFEAAA
jgi:ubiquinone/menaquinone biosynthesis C-methylase UbiE